MTISFMFPIGIKRYLRHRIKHLLGRPAVQRFIFRIAAIWAEARNENRLAQSSYLSTDQSLVVFSDYIPEISPIIPRLSQHHPEGARINLLLPFLSAAHVFGGAATALRTFQRLSKLFPHARIIVTDEIHPVPKTDDFYSLWPILDHLDPDLDADHIVGLGKRAGRSLVVGPQDVFIATIWYTAHIAFPLLEWQNRQFPNGSEGNRKIIYLIQDFEPGFYPWSTRYALADATYTHPEKTLAVINTEILSKYFELHGYSFSNQQILRPRLNTQLAKIRSCTPRLPKTPTILIYGRPSIDRNAFPLIVSALGIWASVYKEASTWELVGAGENFADIDLGNGVVLRSVGKLNLDEYSELLIRSAIGISLMISPHPSYPPLEMAAFGIKVLTNGYANKNLSNISPTIHSLDCCDPHSLAAALVTTCDEYRSGSKVVYQDAINLNNEFLDGGDELEGIENLFGKDCFLQQYNLNRKNH
ncbi:MAG: hypothetical protein ABTQ25_01620 [Nitrosomonas ureae]